MEQGHGGRKHHLGGAVPKDQLLDQQFQGGHEGGGLSVIEST
ncbi:hypothetical protein [Azospirillum oryzae]|nr:hypothetical protein [Azospirillum oryzae]